MFWNKIKDRYLTWKTGRNAPERAWDKWLNETIVRNASTVENYYMNFEHIIEVDYEKVFDCYSSFCEFVRPEFSEYAYPNKPLGQNAVVNVFRGERDQWDKQFHIHDFGYDKTFAATNNEQDAMMIALKFG